MARILAVEDSPSMRLLVKLSLEEAGHQVVVAPDGLEGLAVLSREKVDLIVTDVNMPRMNGIEFIKALRKQGVRFTPVIVLTTEVNPQLKEQARLAGAAGWLVKPFNAPTFLQAVRRVLP
jgi:two-component system chemotaxis response regulator CheY